MKLSTLAWKTVTGFAAGVLAGAFLHHRRAGKAPRTRRPAARHEVPRQSQSDTGGQEQPAPPVPGNTATRVRPGAKGERSTPRGVQGMTKQQLYEEARRRNIRGRSTMTKAELRRALS